MVDAPSALPITFKSMFLPLKLKDEVRPITFNPFIFESASRISSAIPSPKYSWSLVGLISINERTAIDFSTFSIGLINLGTNKYPCLLYTSDAADEEDSVDLGGRRIIKKKK